MLKDFIFDRSDYSIASNVFKLFKLFEFKLKLILLKLLFGEIDIYLGDSKLLILLI